MKVASTMRDQKSNRILKVVYFNPDDPRVILPMRWRIGLTLNFGHPRAVTALAWICGTAVLALVVVPIVAHPVWFAREPVDLIWVVSANLAAVALVHLNKWFAWSDLRILSLASFGV